MNNAIGIRRVEFVRGIFTKQPIHHQAPDRPLESNFNSETRNAFDNATHGGTNVSANRLHGIASQIIMPATECKGHRNILGGWGEHKIAGYKLYRITTGHEVKHEVHIVYSDRCEFSHQGTIDPSTLFTVDSRKVVSSSISTNVNINGSASLAKDYLALKPVQTNRFGSGNVMSTNTLRPCDALFKMQRLEMGEAFTDFRDQASASGTMGNIHDTNSGIYLSKVINTYKLASKQNEIENLNYGDQEAIYGEAAGMLLDPDDDAGSIFQELKSKSQFIDNGVYDWNEFEDIFGNPGSPAESRCKILGQMRTSESLLNESAGFSIDSKESLIGYRINLILARELSTRLIMSCNVIIEQDSRGLPVIAITNAEKMFEETSNDALIRSIGELEGILEIELLGMMRQYCDSFDVRISATAFSYNDYVMRIDGNNIERFTCPVFCNAVITPMLGYSDGNDSESLGFASNIKMIIDEVINSTNGNHLNPNAPTANMLFDPNSTGNSNHAPSQRIITNPNGGYGRGFDDDAGDMLDDSAFRFGPKDDSDGIFGGF